MFTFYQHPAANKSIHSYSLQPFRMHIMAARLTSMTPIYILGIKASLFNAIIDAVASKPQSFSTYIHLSCQSGNAKPTLSDLCLFIYHAFQATASLILSFSGTLTLYQHLRPNQQ